MKIKKVSNGYIVKVKGDEGNSIKIVFEEKEDKKDFDPEAVRELLFTILEQLGIFISNRKYERENISIEIAHGTHYDCEDKNCEICKDYNV